MRTTSAIRAVIFDWAGTAVDFGSMAPVAAFAAAFDSAGVTVSTDEIRRHMGLEKRQHLAQMLRDDAVVSRWHQANGHAPSEADLSRLYDAFNAHLVDILPSCADPIPGLLDAIAKLRTTGIKIGSNSGYSRPMMDVLSRAARERGFEPDCIVSASDVAAARPAPDLSRKCLELLGLPMDCVGVKVDDTQAGIEEGKNAGLWTVAVAVSGNEVGLSLEEWSVLESKQQTQLRTRAYERLRQSSPDYIIDTVADLDDIIEDIEMRADSGERIAGLR
jgi:phosphonoacetaldehyde hydrolase